MFYEFLYLILSLDFKARLVLIHLCLKFNTSFYVLLFWETRVELLSRGENGSEFFFLPKNCAKIAKPAVTLRPNSHQVQQKEEIAIT